MAIQIPNPGTGNGQTGDNEFVLWSKVKDNFSNQAHAASRLVGTKNGNLAEHGTWGISSTGIGGAALHTAGEDLPTLLTNLISKGTGFFRPTQGAGVLSTNSTGFFAKSLSSYAMLTVPYNASGNIIAVGGDLGNTGDNINGERYVHKLYTDRNTTLDGNGALKPSSPVLRVFSDCITGNDDGDAMGATFTKNGVGDYTITGTTGLRTDGWYVVIPNDMNGNPKVAITLDDTDGVITLKSYVRIFDMSTFKFGPDLDQPLDVPDGRWIDLRFNDLPDDAQMGV